MTVQRATMAESYGMMKWSIDALSCWLIGLSSYWLHCGGGVRRTILKWCVEINVVAVFFLLLYCLLYCFAEFDLVLWLYWVVTAKCTHCHQQKEQQLNGVSGTQLNSLWVKMQREEWRAVERIIFHRVVANFLEGGWSLWCLRQTIVLMGSTREITADA